MRPLPRPFCLLLVGGAGLVAVACGVATHLCWNLTDSLPRGLYLRRRAAAAPARNAIVAIPVPPSVEGLVFGRRYLPAGAQLFKRVAGLPGDRVCVNRERYEVNGELLGPVLASDSAGNALPSALFCGVVPEGMYFLAGDTRRSFDSRYFGPVPAAALTDRLTPLWTY
jgi:conjugative transfer signal peptidase TraF